MAVATACHTQLTPLVKRFWPYSDNVTFVSVILLKKKKKRKINKYIFFMNLPPLIPDGRCIQDCPGTPLTTKCSDSDSFISHCVNTHRNLLSHLHLFLITQITWIPTDRFFISFQPLFKFSETHWGLRPSFSVVPRLQIKQTIQAKQYAGYTKIQTKKQ